MRNAGLVATHQHCGALAKFFTTTASITEAVEAEIRSIAKCAKLRVANTKCGVYYGTLHLLTVLYNHCFDGLQLCSA
jgi:hypothetical protein